MKDYTTANLNKRLAKRRKQTLRKVVAKQDREIAHYEDLFSGILRDIDWINRHGQSVFNKMLSGNFRVRNKGKV